MKNISKSIMILVVGYTFSLSSMQRPAQRPRTATPASLVSIGKESVVNQLLEGRLKLSEIKPKLPIELYDQITQEYLNKCIARLPLEKIPFGRTHPALFNSENTFEIGETVLVYEQLLHAYIYACVTKILPRDIIELSTKYSQQPNYYPKDKVGKIIPAGQSDTKKRTR